ncbi:VOC family protein [Consotaella aegiceratis]|uniref:VOC family protein n=1 Tax=Consotaella aegiceratis TaxID=3097961 RepID=UPI002F414791
MNHPNYILLYVDDSQKSESFYTALLAAEPVASRPGFSLFALKSGLMLGLWGKHTVQPAPAALAGGFEIGLKVETEAEVDAIYAAWSEQGIAIAQAPAEASFGHNWTPRRTDVLAALKRRHW